MWSREIGSYEAFVFPSRACPLLTIDRTLCLQEHPLSSSPSSLPAIGVDVGFFSTKYTTGRRDKRSPHAVEVMQSPSMAPRISGSMKSITSADRLSGAQVEVEPGALHFVGTDVYQVAPTTPARHDLNRSALGVAMPLNGLAVSTEALPNTVATQQGSPDTPAASIPTPTPERIDDLEQRSVATDAIVQDCAPQATTSPAPQIEQPTKVAAMSAGTEQSGGRQDAPSRQPNLLGRIWTLVVAGAKHANRSKA